MRGKEYLTAVRPGDNLLILTTLLFPEDLRNPAKELKSLPEIVPARGKELDMAVTLIDSMTEGWEPDSYHDTYTQRVEKLIEDKAAGREIISEEEPAAPTKVVDLFDALSRSVEGRKKRRESADSGDGGGKRRGASKEEGPDLGTLSRAELDKMARDLDIKGRSKMNRDELAEAVAAARSAGAA
jgi:DNA end-binding protein Ku